MSKKYWWKIADDGADWKCPGCEKYKKHSEIIYYETPDGTTGISCLECIDSRWLKGAIYRGVKK